MTNGKASHPVLTSLFCLGSEKTPIYFLKKPNKNLKFLILIDIFFLSFFNCSRAKAAEISEGRKLYPASKNIYLPSYRIPSILVLNRF